MSKILSLAQDFEKKSKQQVHDTEQSLSREFRRHEEFISEALRSSEKKIKGDISAQNRRMGWLVLKTWLGVVVTVFMVLMTTTGVITWQGRQIAENWDVINQQKSTISQLEGSGGKIQVSTCGKQSRLCIKVDLNEKGYGSNQGGYPWMIPEGY